MKHKNCGGKFIKTKAESTEFKITYKCNRCNTRYIYYKKRKEMKPSETK